jgi:hypothetical protein
MPRCRLDIQKRQSQERKFPHTLAIALVVVISIPLASTSSHTLVMGRTSLQHLM